MKFYEKIGLVRFLHHFATGQPAFYFRKSFPLRLFSRIFPSFISSGSSCKKLDFGHVQYATHVMKNSFLNGKKFVDEMRHGLFFEKCNRLFGINFPYIFRLLVFSEAICPRYEFHELAIRYAKENPGRKYIFHVNPNLSKNYVEEFKRIGEVHARGYFDFVYFVMSIIISPLFLWAYWKIKGQNGSLLFNNNIICNAVKIPTYEIYKELFGIYTQTKYVISSPYAERYTREQLDKVGIIPISLDLAGYNLLRKHVYSYVRACLSSCRELFIFGSEILLLFYNIILGRSKAPHGQGNLYITFEHFCGNFAVRNEFLRMEGSQSVFLSKNLNIFSPYDFNEIEQNYDILCSSGKHLEILYSRNSANTRIILPTGSYDIHRGIIKEDDFEQRIARLKSFKGDSIIVTFLSTGLVDRSYSYEVRLMNLAKMISRQPGVKVFIRMKTPFKMPEHNPFYDTFIENNDSIMLTGAEYELFDFLAVTDLFVTSFSSSGCDVAMCGGQIMYVDYLKSPDVFLFQEMISDVFVSEEKAFDEIMKWINDSKDGLIRSRHTKIMDRLAEYMGYTFPDFETYKGNLMSQLSNHASLFSEICDRENV